MIVNKWATLGNRVIASPVGRFYGMQLHAVAMCMEARGIPDTQYALTVWYQLTPAFNGLARAMRGVYEDED